jgi:putative flippase GtrA
MNALRISLARFAFWGICATAALWAGLTLFFEFKLGIPATGEEWAHRAMGWFVQLVLMRTFYRGTRKYHHKVS